MFSDELIDFLKNNFPVQLSEISAAMDLLIESLDEAAEVVTARGNELSKGKEFINAIDLLKKANELHTLSKRVQGYSDIFQLEEVALVSEDEILEDIEKTYPNYSEYEVDNTAVHTLHENFVHKRPHAFELRGRKVYVTEWKRMLIETCDILAGIDSSIIAGFPNNPKFNGRKSHYFRTENPESMRSPQKFKNMEMYVETNFSANFIRNLIIRMINYYKIPPSEYKIYLRADYTGLHQKSEGNEISTDERLSQQIENKQGRQETAVVEITNDCIQHISDCLQKPLASHSKAIYQTYDHKTTVVCLTSRKRDKGRYLEYWFGLRVNQKDALESVEESYLALGCGSENKIILIPFADFTNWLDDMSTTGDAQHIRHWHITIIEKQNSFMLRLKAGRQNVNLTEYVLKH